MKVFIFFLIFSSFALAKTAPQFRGSLLEGGKFSLQDSLEKDKALLVSFWASWCQPCLEELTAISKGMKENPALPLNVVTVNVDTSETSSDVKPILRQHGFKFKVLLDPKHEIFSKYHADASLPFSVLLSPKGEILETFTGYSKDMLDKIKTHVEKSLG